MFTSIHLSVTIKSRYTKYTISIVETVKKLVNFIFFIGFWYTKYQMPIAAFKIYIKTKEEI